MRRRNAALLEELEAHGEAHDARTPAHNQRMLNITPETGAFLEVLILSSRAQRILEVGTSNGYSTLWLAGAALVTGGRVTTAEHQPAKAELARATFARAEAIAPIDLRVGDAGVLLARSPAAAWDFIFLDADRTRYQAWWPDLRRTLAPGGLMVMDNATSHPVEAAPLIAAVEADPDFSSVLVPIGKGEFLACKAP
jgi:predicted O-methyltransferase YrrM